jgi:hypothetical protein
MSSQRSSNEPAVIVAAIVAAFFTWFLNNWFVEASVIKHLKTMQHYWRNN